MSTKKKESLNERIEWLEMTEEDPQLLVWLLELRRHRENGLQQPAGSEESQQGFWGRAAARESIRANKAEAIVADVEEVIGLLAEREWAEHCTKTDIGKRLEEAITELHNEAAPEPTDQKPRYQIQKKPSYGRESVWIDVESREEAETNALHGYRWRMVYDAPAPVLSLGELVPNEKLIRAEAGGYAPVYSLQAQQLFIDGATWLRATILRNVEEKTK